MAFLKKKKRVSFSVLAGILLFIIAGVGSGGAYYLHKTRLDAVRDSYDEQIQQYEYDMYLLERQVFIPNDDIPCGTVLVKELFSPSKMRLEISQEDLFNESDLGKVNTVELQSGIPVLKSMTADAELRDDVRELEFNMLMIQTNQNVGDYIDVRITFPNGEDYIVLGKKMMKGLNREENLVWLWLDETEIHRINSAIIDAYIHSGSKVYAATYVLPELQNEATPYYPVNLDVMELMKKDPNILKTAGDSLAIHARRVLESNLEEMAGENVSKVTSGVAAEISKNQEIRKRGKPASATEAE